MLQRIHIITPCSRPQNLLQIANSILSQRGKLPFVRWWIVFDLNRVSFSQINEVSLNISDSKYGSIQPTFLFNKSEGQAGHQHRNLVLDCLSKEKEDGWFYNVDDDNILHEDFCEVVEELDKQPAAIVVNQILKNGAPNRSPINNKPLIACAENMKTYFVDTAQVIFNLKSIGELRFDEAKYNADGIFIQSLFEREGNFIFINKNLCYYNYLS